MVGLFRRVWTAIKGEPITDSLELFREIYGTPPSRSGETVTWKTALEVSAVLACVRVIAQGVSQVPFRLYRDLNGSRVLAKEHPLYPLLYRRPNRWQTSFEFRETLMFHTMLTNNAFVFVNRVGRAREVRELIPIEPGRVCVDQLDDYRLEYKVTGKNGGSQTFGQDAIWHLRGPSWNSWIGLDATRLAREAIGLSIALERGQAEFQKGGARTSGLLAVDDKLSPEQYSFFAAWLDKYLPGGERANKPMIADRGATYTPFSITAVEQQLVESRKHQVEEICREFRVMPLMVGHPAEMAARAATESIFQMHVVHTLGPHYERIEQSADVNLLSESERTQGLYSKFTPNALLRGVAKDRAEFYTKGLGSGGAKGWLTQNDVRGFEEMDRSDDPEADKLPQQNSSVKPSESAPAPQAEPTEDDQ